MNLYETLPEGAPQVFGEEALGSYAYDVLTVDVPVGSWISALEIARDKLGCTYFDWLSAVDEPGTGFRICAHVVALENHRVRRLLLRTTVPHAAASLPSAVAVYAGAAWHERETFEMFGVTFTDHPNLIPLLLPENFEGHPLRKDFVLAARVAKAWPGAKEPGEGADPDGPKRRQMLPPGVPDPNEWGPLKGQLPPAPTRPARTPRAAGEGAPVRRARSVSDGSTSQTTPEGAPESPAPPRPARRTRSVSDGSASQAPAEATPGTPEPPAPPRPARRTRSVSDGSASQTAPEGPPASPAPDAPSPAPRRTAPRSSDAPWHDPKPAFEPDPNTPAAPSAPTPATPTPAAPTPAAPATPATPESAQAGPPAAAPAPTPVGPEPVPAPASAEPEPVPAPATDPDAPEQAEAAPGAVSPTGTGPAPAGPAAGRAEPAAAAPTPAPDPTEPSAGGPA
ncbi:NADH-quinone oxidoreductase subunit C [Streptomyces sp. PvR034]|uniref:NADH-quinone oxidoreductase subunit C n=1 Tax=Streptomyces sp. PvR034 TaxID=3156401 RepID=UPI003396F37E